MPSLSPALLSAGRSDSSGVPARGCRTRSSGTWSITSPGFKDNLPPPGLYHRILREIEGPLIGAALAATRGNQIRAAELLGVNRNTLRKKVRDLELQVVRTSR